MGLLAFRIAGMLAVVGIGVLSLVPGEARPHVLGLGSLEHLTAYFIAATLLGIGFLDSGTSRSDSNAALGISFLLTGYGGILEAAQLFVPGRTPGMLDWCASALGAWFGVGFVWLLRGSARRALR
jgi:VanZ family protein